MKKGRVLERAGLELIRLLLEILVWEGNTIFCSQTKCGARILFPSLGDDENRLYEQVLERNELSVFGLGGIHSLVCG